MAANNAEVLDFVRSTITEQPGIGTRDLYRMASEAFPQVGELTPQQFHGRYFLTAKRALAPKGEGTTPKKPRKKSTRAAKKTAAPRQGKRAARTSEATPAAAEAQPQAVQAPSRDKVRSVFLKFARDFASAESRTDIVAVMSKVDDYVDQVVGHG